MIMRFSAPNGNYCSFARSVMKKVFASCFRHGAHKHFYRVTERYGLHSFFFLFHVEFYLLPNRTSEFFPDRPIWGSPVIFSLCDEHYLHSYKKYKTHKVLLRHYDKPIEAMAWQFLDFFFCRTSNISYILSFRTPF